LNFFAHPKGVPKDVVVGHIMGVLKKIFAEHWSPTRMENLLYFALATLVEQEAATVLDIPPLFSDHSFRAQALKAVTDNEVLEFWHRDWEPQSRRAQQEAIGPILNRIRPLYRNRAVRNILCQPTTIDFRKLMDEGGIFLASLAGLETQIEAETIGALLISQIQMAAMSRADLPKEQRQPFYLAVDELQNFTTSSLSQVLSEARKYGLSLTAANQFLAQLEGDTLDAILGNVGTMILFQVGPQDARRLQLVSQPRFEAMDLLNLGRFETVVKLQWSAGRPYPAFDMRTLPPPEKPATAEARERTLRALSIARHGLERDLVEAMLAPEVHAAEEAYPDPPYYD
jgi:hypothetical protein